MTKESDPSVYFSAERTLLSWVRTSLAAMGLGFVVARAGVFVSIVLQQELETHNRGFSTYIGLLLVLLGVVILLLAALQFRTFSRSFDRSTLPKGYRVYTGMGVAYALVLIGIAMMVYLYF